MNGNHRSAASSVLLERQCPPRNGACTILNTRFDLVDYRAVMQTIGQWRRSGRRHYVTMSNPRDVILYDRDLQMRQALMGAELTLPDGVGIILAAQLLGLSHHGRVTGPTLMLRLCDWGRGPGYRHFFYGGREGVADQLAERLVARFPGLQVAGTYCPPFRTLTGDEEHAMLDTLNAAEADIVWVGLGAPKQEIWMARYRSRLDAPALIGVGAAFDFHSGSAKWAPAVVRKVGLEWAYRLVHEPRRMWPRNVYNTIFLARVLRQCLFGTNGRNGTAVRSEST